VDRPRRNQNNARTVLQKAMQIKKKKNLEGIKGNSFTILQIDYLNQIAQDASIEIGCYNDDNAWVIDNLVKEEEKKHNRFVEETPDVMLHVNIDIELDG
jgi:hypothetical protein